MEWRVPVRVVWRDGELDFRGPQVDGKRGDRHIYLNWFNREPDGQLRLFRRGKVMLEGLDPRLVKQAEGTGSAVTCTVNLTNEKGLPSTARFGAADLDWGGRPSRLSTPKGGGNLRADAQRNRARVLEVAAEAFAAEGLSVPVHEIARRAGVGTGTVSRHFPTKEALVAGALLNRAEHMVAEARSLAAAKGPGEALFGFFTSLVKEGVANRGLSEALVGTEFDLETLAAEAGNSIFSELDRLLRRAQRAGEIRKDIDIDDLKALFKACSDRGRDANDPRKRDRIVRVVFDGLRPNTRRTRVSP